MSDLERLAELHPEFIDEKGKHHTYEFLSQDAKQDNNQWYEGPAGGGLLPQRTSGGTEVRQRLVQPRRDGEAEG